MVGAGYPEMAAHTKCHAAFRAKVGDLARRHHDGEDVGRELRATLSRWLHDHVAAVDARLGNWLRANRPLKVTPTAAVDHGVNRLGPVRKWTLVTAVAPIKRISAGGQAVVTGTAA